MQNGAIVTCSAVSFVTAIPLFSCEFANINLDLYIQIVMNMKYTSIIIIAIVMLGWTGSSCRKASATDSVFAEAERLMYTYPDSALKLIEAIPNPELLVGQSQADYALLLTEASSQNLIYASSDSLIRIAVDYYKNAGDKEKEIKSLLYLGDVLLDLERYSEAVSPLKQAEGMMEHVTDKRMQALIYRNLGYLNQKSGNFSLSLVNYKKATEITGEKSFYPLKTLKDIRNEQKKRLDADSIFYMAFQAPTWALRADMYESLYRRHLNLGHTQKAKFYMKAYAEAMDSFYHHSKSGEIYEMQLWNEQEIISRRKIEMENKLYRVVFGFMLLLTTVLVVLWIVKKRNERNLQRLRIQVAKVESLHEEDKEEILKLNYMLSQSKQMRQEYMQIKELVDLQDIQALGLYLRLIQIPASFRASVDLPLLKHWLDITSDNFASRLQECFPHLTPGEMSICCLQRMKYSQKKMSEVMQVKEETIRRNIYRICNRLNLASDKVCFERFIVSF